MPPGYGNSNSNALPSGYGTARNYRQHEAPLSCPKEHPMIWLGTAYWFCAKCQQVYVQVLNSPHAAKNPDAQPTDPKACG